MNPTAATKAIAHWQDQQQRAEEVCHRAGRVWGDPASLYGERHTAGVRARRAMEDEIAAFDRALTAYHVLATYSHEARTGIV